MQKELDSDPLRPYSFLSERGQENPRRPQNKMSKEQTTTTPAQDAAQTIPAPAATVSKEAMEAHQKTQATAIGCDAKKTVSGFEYLLILLRAMVKEGIIPAADLPKAASMAKGMKANNSALRQWLYERPEEKVAVSKIAEKYLSMEDPVAPAAPPAKL